MGDNLEQTSEICGDSEDASSLCDEERVRKLFQACDGDGDGYIDSHDLLMVCRELNLEDSLEELMQELGADEHGRISYQEFLRRRLALRPEIDALRSQTGCQNTGEYLPTSSDNSLGAASAGKHESWEFDSGARDLSPEPHTLQKLVEAAGGSLTSGNTSSMLELANKLHLAALASLKGEILDLSSRLHTVTQERDLLDKTLSKIQLEKLRLVAAAEERAELQAQRYEERLTELHSVIAELTRKLERQRTLTIQEEEDDVSDNLSRDAEESTTNVADEAELPEAEADKAIVTYYEEVVKENKQEQLQHGPNDATQETYLNKETATSFQSLDRASLIDELTQLRSENAALREQVARQEAELQYSKADRQRLHKEGKNSPSRRLGPPPALAAAPTPPASSQDDTPICKVAERVMLRKMDRQITGSQLATFGVCNTKVAESIVSELQEADLQELSCNEAVRQKFEIEAERLNSKIEHLRAQNAVLAFTLEESKVQCDKLFLLVGRYESNATALRLALSYCDRAIEAYDVLVALLESELEVFAATCQVPTAGKFNTADSGNVESDDERSDMENRLSKAKEGRKTAETVAKHLLSRLDTSVALNATISPWDEYSHTSSTSSSDSEWNKGKEKQLRDHICKLKCERNTVRATVVELESYHVEPLASRQPISLAEARKLDLETAVLMQELMAVREDKAELRARVYLLEKERAALELKLSSLDTHESTQLATIQHLQCQLQETERLLESQNRERQPGKEGEETEQESELTASLRREANLKDRLQKLTATLERVSKNTELRHQQSADLVNDLKKANSSLVQTLERTKKKYQSRIKKLEQQMIAMVDRHAAQVQLLKQRIVMVEEESAILKTRLGQTGCHSQSSGASETSL